MVPGKFKFMEAISAIISYNIHIVCYLLTAKEIKLPRASGTNVKIF
jgi:hypothetical protein